MMLLNVGFELMLAGGNSQSFLFNDYKKARYSFLLEFPQRCLLVEGLRPGRAS